ncbi:hypothetical protein MHZ92_11510 [Sporosarcina sp. ACRSL]|uniref:hypothetical protein n=1 Tax=Sporosarcina sp. ACRSL TaxID=2918215 RepID=UPI001EF4F94B|nr:hypothetical protein [Sporosarcina sp. ACRSL]MCG7344765.1 hypothetical protein [Sporosarcina sp. ACRSL]
MVKFTESESGAYAEGEYRLWFDKKSQSLRMKLDKDSDLIYFPKDSKAYKELTEKYFKEHLSRS